MKAARRGFAIEPSGRHIKPKSMGVTEGGSEFSNPCGRAPGRRPESNNRAPAHLPTVQARALIDADRVGYPTRCRLANERPAHLRAVPRNSIGGQLGEGLPLPGSAEQRLWSKRVGGGIIYPRPAR